MYHYQSPAKRPRALVDHEVVFRDIVIRIQHAVTTKQRFEVLQNLIFVLEYNPHTRLCNADPRVLSYLVKAGVINSLCLQLGFVLHRHGSCKEEMELTCTAVSLFYRHCPDLITDESLRQRQNDLFRFLPELFRRDVVLPVITLWHSCSSSHFGTATLLQDRSMLQAVGQVFEQYQVFGDQVIMESLGLLKNVTYYGEDFRRRIVEHPGLLSSLTGLPFRDAQGKDQERLSAVIRNLSLSSDTRLLLAQRPDVLTSIARMASSTNNTTLRNILNTLANLAMDADSCLVMVFHGEGVLVELLKRFVGYEDDAVIRKRAARTLKLLARDTSAPLLVHDTVLMDNLSYRALHDANNDVRAEAAEAFAKCAGLIKAPMAQHEAVLDALTHLAASPNINSDVMARALKAQAAHIENRRAMAQRKELMTALANIAMSDDASKSAKENACSTFLDLSDDEINRTRIATTPILEALVRNSTDRRDGYSTIRDLAVRTLLNLSLSKSNRKIMATHASLLQSLLYSASSTQTHELKKEIKAVILQLAAEL